MKNLRINKKAFSHKKFVLVVLPVVVTIVLSGCNFLPNGERAKYTNLESEKGYYEVYESQINIEENIDSESYKNENLINNQTNFLSIDVDDLNIPLKDIGKFNFTNVKVKYDINNHKTFYSSLDEIDVDYTYKDLYNFDEVINEYNKLNFSNNHETKLNSLTFDDVYNIILENNKQYKKTKNSSIFRELESKELKNIVKIIVDTVNDFINNNENISIDRVKCVLGDLKVFNQKSSMNNAFVTDDNCLILSPNMLKFATTINGDNADEDVFIHEIIHLLQKGCNCDLNLNDNLKRNFGISYGFKNVKLNSLDFSWLYEASAEKSMQNYTGHDPLVYKNMISYLESLSIVNLVNDTYKVNDTENLSFKRGYEELYKFFDAETESEKRDILNLMYSIQIMQQAPSDFYNLLEEKTGLKKDNNLIDKINYEIKGSICETLTKIFYKNLSKAIIEKEISLGDIFYLISIFENDINNHVLYNSPKKYQYNEHFMNTYIDIQDNFFEELSKTINCSEEEIINNYNNYTSKIKIGDSVVKNYDLKFLNSDKINYLFERESALNSEAAPAIRFIQEEFLNPNTKKVH